MARIRTVKPSFTQDEDLSEIAAESQLFAVGLLCYADDDGYFNANPGLLQAAIFPLRKYSLTIHGILSELSRAKFIELSKECDGKRYGRIIHFREHQVINRPQPSKLKDLPLEWEKYSNPQLPLLDQSRSAHGVLMEDSHGNGMEWKGREGKGEQDKPPLKPEFHERDYAFKIVEECALTQSHLREAADAIKAEALVQGSLEKAFNVIFPAAQAEIKAKGALKPFWFRDTPWRLKTETAKPKSTMPNLTERFNKQLEEGGYVQW